MKDTRSEKERGLDEGYEAGVSDAKQKAIEIVVEYSKKYFLTHELGPLITRLEKEI